MIEGDLRLSGQSGEQRWQRFVQDFRPPAPAKEVAHAQAGFSVRGKTGVFQVQARLLLNWRQCKGDKRVERRRAAAPAIGNAVWRIERDHLALDDPVPAAHRGCLESKAMPKDRLEIVGHEPLSQGIGRGKRLPDGPDGVRIENFVNNTIIVHLFVRSR